MTEKTRQEYSSKNEKFFTALFLGTFLMIPASVIGFAVKDWVKEQEKIKYQQQKKEEIKAKTVYYMTEAKKTNQR